MRLQKTPLRFLRSLATFALLVVAVSPVLAETPAELYEKLRVAIREERDAAADKRNSDVLHRLATLDRHLAYLRPDALEQLNIRQTVERIREFRVSSDSPKVNELADKLMGELLKIQAQAEKDLADRYTVELRKACEAVLKAEKMSDLDEPLKVVGELMQELVAVQQNGNNKLPGLNYEAGRTTQELLVFWQDFLRPREVRADLRRTADYSDIEGRVSRFAAGVATLVPRSQLLERARVLKERQEQPAKVMTAAEGEQKTRELLAELKTLDDLQPVTAKLEAIRELPREIRNTGSPHAQVPSFQKTFTRFEDLVYANMHSFSVAYRALQQGNANWQTYGSLRISASPWSGSRDGDLPKELGVIQMQLIRFAMPKLFGAGPDRAMAEGEGLSAYLRRMRVLAEREKDWAFLEKIIETGENLENPGTSYEWAPLRMILAARNHERAGHVNYAVNSYLQALNTPSQSIPAEWVGEQLKALKAAHPAAYERGEKLYETSTLTASQFKALQMAAEALRPPPPPEPAASAVKPVEPKAGAAAKKKAAKN